MKFARAYSYYLSKNPLLTKMTTSSVIFGTAEIIRSKIDSYYVGTRRPTNPINVLKSALVGGLIAAPSLHLWYSITLPRIVKSSSVTNAIKKTLIDQAVFAPYLLALTVGAATLPRTTSMVEMTSVFQVSFKHGAKENWKVWPIAQMINFCLIPAKFQILYVNLFGLAWQSYQAKLVKSQQIMD